MKHFCVVSGSGAGPKINPATGLPMIEDQGGGVDIGGNPYGTNLHQDLDIGSGSPFDPFGGGISGGGSIGGGGFSW